jgi:hypothetical protein
LANKTSIWVYIFLIVAIIGAVVGLSVMNYRYSVQNPGGNDFLARWTGARAFVMEGTSPYSDSVSVEAQKMIYGHKAKLEKGEDLSQFAYPFYSLIFFGLFGMLDYTLARAIWMTLLQISLVAIVIISLRLAEWNPKGIAKILIIFFGIFWYPSIRTIILGQFSGIDALMILGAILLLRQKKDTEAGILMMLSTSKPQMSYLLVIYCILWAVFQKRYNFLKGFFGCMVVLVGASFILLPTWLLEWLRQMISYPAYTDRIGSIVSIVANAMPGIRQPVNIVLFLIGYGYLAFEWIRSLRKDYRVFLWTALMTLVVTNIVAYRTATPHYVALLPAVLLMIRVISDRWGSVGKAVNWAVMLLLFAGYWVLFLFTVKATAEQAIMYLPIPIITFLGLFWIRWWAIRPPKLPFEQYGEYLS